MGKPGTSTGGSAVRSSSLLLAAGLLAAGFVSGGCATSQANDVCAGVECAGRGFCVADSGTAYCTCIAGFRPEGLSCVAFSSDPCSEIDCDGHGACVESTAGPTCECEAGYHHPADYGLHCAPTAGWDGGPTDGDAHDDGAGCTPGAPESCNGRDDDCDGLTDETFDLDFDPGNCGACGNICPDGTHSTGACVLSECAASCEAGWSDLDRNAANGCEAVCTPSGSPDESACEGRDDDCDGRTDEDWTTDTRCGNGACQRYEICFRGLVRCEPRLPPTSSDVTCDGLDDDCDGRVDEDCPGADADADADADGTADESGDGDAGDDAADADASFCGNGIVELPEACDGNSRNCGPCDGTQPCRADCTWGSCSGGGYVGCTTCSSGCYHLNTVNTGCAECLAGICGLCGAEPYRQYCGAQYCLYEAQSPDYEYGCHCP